MPFTLTLAFVSEARIITNNRRAAKMERLTNAKINNDMLENDFSRMFILKQMDGSVMQ